MLHNEATYGEAGLLRLRSSRFATGANDKPGFANE